ncbi:ABC-2 type transport system permease protein [Peptococcaceae bacterium DYL19]|nr:ABC-2 type transport system permease protein [Phosphitispora fastidiosa]
MDNYSYFLFAGLLPWMFFSNSILISAGVVVQNSNLIKKIYFPREILPISVTLSGLVNYILSFIILIPAMLIFKIQPTEAIIALPIVVIIQLVMVMGFSLWIAGLNVYFRDLEHILSVFLMAWFYLTPIIYPLKMIPEKYLMLINLNPVAPVMIAYQDILYYGVFPKWTHLGYDLLFSVILLFTGLVVYARLKRNFAEEI